MTSPDHPSAKNAGNQVTCDLENPFTQRLAPLHQTVFKIVALTLPPWERPGSAYTQHKSPAGHLPCRRVSRPLGE